MAHQALARKYRPSTFDGMVGQDAIVLTLKNALSSGKIHPAYIFSGIRGVGKTTAARLFARGLNCQAGPTAEPCGRCPSCEEIAAGRSMDVLEIDGATNTKAEEARDLMQAARYMPARDRFRVFIIDEVHMLSTAAFNALLKTFEEPPPHAVFLLATTEPHKIPETIHSRAQHFQFRRVPAPKVAAYLGEVCGAEGVEAEAAALDLVARSGEGSVRDSLTLLDRLLTSGGGRLDEAMTAEALGVVGRAALLGLLAAVAAGRPSEIPTFVDDVRDRGRNHERLLNDMVSMVRTALRRRLAGQDGPGDEDETEVSGALAPLSEEDLLRLWDLLTSTQQRLKGAPDPDALLEIQLTKAALLPRILPLDQLLGRVPAASAQEVPRESGARRPDDPPQGAPPEAPKDGEGGLRFKALIPFTRMDEKEAKSFEEDERLGLLRKSIGNRMPLLAPALASATLSVDPEGVLHLVLPPGSTTAAALLASPERVKILEDLAREVGLTGRFAVENGRPEPEEAAPPKKDEGRAVESPAVKNVLKLLGGKVVKVTEGAAAPLPGEDDAEPE